MKKRLWILYALLGLLAVFLLQLGLFYWIMKDRAANSHPLVLIQAPLDRQSLVVNKGFIIHATASADKPLQKMELWVDDIQITKKLPPAGDSLRMMVLSEAWVPATTGVHTLTVKTVTNNGVIGQASIEVDVVEASLASEPKYIVEEGDTLESIADGFDISVDELIALNGGGGSDLTPGDELVVPAFSSGGSGEMEQTTGSEAGSEGAPPQEEAPN
ncbi:LysM peptidoglycan-binding domain-containing protein, partial [bacterium]|nr:LysM peptidoglycan-binding domain-containing protein [bacterium]